MNKVIEDYRKALDNAPDSARSTFLDDLAHALKIRFEVQGDPQDIDEVVHLLREVLELCPPSHPEHSASLHDLAIAIKARFEHRGNLKDIEEAIKLFREALLLLSSPQPAHGVCLTNLANALHIRFLQQGDSRDLDEAIDFQRQAVALREILKTLMRLLNSTGTLDLNATPNRTHGKSLHNLANAICTRFQWQHDSKDLDEAIDLLRKAQVIQASFYTDRYSSLNDLALALETKFKQQGKLEDIDETIQCHREALKILAPHHPDRAISLNNIANAITTRFKQLGDPKDINEAITLLTEAANLLPKSHLSQGDFLNNLATAVELRYEHQGDPKDIDSVVELSREALGHRDPSHPGRGGSHNNLANALKHRFGQWGDLVDIEEAIRHYNAALAVHPAPHTDYKRILNNLAAAIRDRFYIRRDLKDLDKAIELHRKALESYEPNHTDRWMALNSLAGALSTRFQQRGDTTEDLDEAIELLRQAVDNDSAFHPARGKWLYNLANVLFTRFLHSRDIQVIHEAIKYLKEALALCDPPHPDRCSRLINLSIYLGQLCAPPHSDRSTSLCNLAKDIRIQFEQHGDPKDIDEAIELIREASAYMSSPPLSRFHASNIWAAIAAMHSHSSCLDAFHTSIGLLPQLAAFHLDLNSRRQMLTREDITSLSSVSATCAISLNQNNVAVEFLEATRSIFWAQALHLRTPLDQLANVRPDLAIKLRELSRQLEHASFRDTSRNLFTDTQRKVISMEAEGTRCRELNEDWEEAVKSVRLLPGFEDFMQPKKIVALQQAAISNQFVRR
ncbi:hypothetical protein B0H13DRAFT_1924004 [Mycena leptocephala]|nr:hypothetical protein B0H13DRAFT_1924004 [Mycena leptocephala]